MKLALHHPHLNICFGVEVVDDVVSVEDEGVVNVEDEGVVNVEDEDAAFEVDVEDAANAEEDAVKVDDEAVEVEFDTQVGQTHVSSSSSSSLPGGVGVAFFFGGGNAKQFR